MIIREWRGRTSVERADAYPEHFRRTVLPELKQLSGFGGATLCRRDTGGVIEYLVLTRGASLRAIETFAGPAIGTAVVEPGAIAALVDFDTEVRHYEVVDDTP
jgi:hypothetical protein